MVEARPLKRERHLELLAQRPLELSCLNVATVTFSELVAMLG